jgi:PKD repeat protein
MSAHFAVSRAARILALTMIVGAYPPSMGQEPAPDSPAAARDYFVQQRTTFGAIPAGAYDQALSDLQTRSRYVTSTNTTEGAPIDLCPPQPSSQWDWLGPSNVGGRIRSLIVHPAFASNSTLYAGAADGGVWRSAVVNGVRSWYPIDAGILGNIAVNSLAVVPDSGSINAYRPADPNFDTVYAGTGEGYYNDDAVPGNGIYRLDPNHGCQEWSVLRSTQFNQLNQPIDSFHYVNKLVASRRDASGSYRIYAATRAGVYRSSDEGASWLQVQGPTLYHTVGVQQVPYGFFDLVIRNDQADGVDYLFATEGGRIPLGNDVPAYPAKIWRNQSAASSASWELVQTEAGMGLTTLAISPRNQNVIYALSAETSPTLAGTYRDGLHAVYRSASSGDPLSWITQVSNADVNPLNKFLLSYANILVWNGGSSTCGTPTSWGNGAYPNLGWYNNVIAVDPSPDPITGKDIVWVAGVDLFRSNDAGQTWGRASTWNASSYIVRDANRNIIWAPPATDYVHADQHSIVFGPSPDYTAFIGNDGGVYSSANRLAAVEARCPGYPGTPYYPSQLAIQWNAVNTGLGVTQFYHGLPDASNSVCLGGTQDNGTVLDTSPSAQTSWAKVEPPLLDGDGGFVAIDSSTSPGYYAEESNGNIQVSTDGGATWLQQYPGGGGLLFVTPIAQDPSRTSRIWTGGFQASRRDGVDSTWLLASSSFAVGNPPTGRISAIAVSPANPNNVLLGLQDGRIARSMAALASTGTTGWDTQTSTTTPPAPFAGHFISSISFDPNDPSDNTVYLTVSALDGTAVLWKATGVFNPQAPMPTWVSLMGTDPQNHLPSNIPGRWVIADNTRTRRLFVGTDIGVFTSTDAGGSWMPEATGFPPMVVNSMAQKSLAPDNSFVYAFTHGRGAFRVPTTYLPGDVDENGARDVNDVFYLINTLFAGGPFAAFKRGDVNCTGRVDVADVFFLINSLFAGGPAPPTSCGVLGGNGPSFFTAAAPDTFTVASVSAPVGTTSVSVPVYVNDRTGNSLGSDRPAGQDITQIWFEVVHGANCITGATFSRSSGVLHDLTTSLEEISPGPGGFKYAVNLTAAIPFTHGADPGDKIGDLVFTLSGCPALPIPLTVTMQGTWAASLGCVQCVGLNMIESPEAADASWNGLIVTSGSIKVLGPVPSISGVAAPIGPTAGGTSVTISGSNFVSGATVSFGGAPATVTSVLSNQIQAATPAHAYGAVDVVVTNPDTQTATRASGFVYDNPPAATLTASPTSGVAPIAVTLSGAGSTDQDSAAGDSVVSYRFTAGDGSAPVTQSGMNFSHTYSVGGTYTATLTVTDSKGLTSSLASATVTIAVPVDNATVTNINVPSTMVKGHSYTLQWRVTNTGNTTWTYGSYYLESQNPRDNTTFGAALLNTCGDGSPGASCSPTIQVTAPSTTGTYNIQRQMVHNGANFGNASPNVVVTVTNH